MFCFIVSINLILAYYDTFCIILIIMQLNLIISYDMQFRMRGKQIIS